MTDPVRLSRTEDHLLRSEHVGDELHLWIAPPVPGWRGPSPEPPRVLWVLDGDLFFGAAVEITRLMHQFMGELPPLLVVGVAYDTDDPRLQAELRTRDLTPTADRSFASMAPPTGREPTLPEDRRMGRAPELLAFLSEEARPFVASRHEVSPEGSILFGSSLGGLFAIWSLLTAPGHFDHVIAASPALWWDDELLFDVEERVAAQRDDLPASLVLVVGEGEEPPGAAMLERFRLVTNVRRMAERLRGRGYPSLGVTDLVLPGESHTSTAFAALTRGLRTLLGPPAAPPVTTAPPAPPSPRK